MKFDTDLKWLKPLAPQFLKIEKSQQVQANFNTDEYIRKLKERQQYNENDDFMWPVFW